MPTPTFDPVSLPQRIADFRDRYRERVIGAYYHGYLHLAFVVVGSLATILWAVFQLGYDREGAVHPVEPLEWLAIPITLFIANLVEYAGHRGPMHHRKSWAGLLFHRHTEEHHQFFTDDWMTCRSPRDFKIVLFPPIMLVTYLGLVALPASVVCYFVFSRNVAALALATSMFYFLSYEVLHFTYHMDENTFVGRMWMVRVLREHHRIHHDQRLMAKYNFNITWPVADLLFRTIYHGPKQPPAERHSSGPAAVTPLKRDDEAETAVSASSSTSETASRTG